MNWKVVAAVVIMTLAVAPVASVSAQETANDGYEPNDEISSATDISPGVYTDLELVSDENDYYAISVDEGETLNITATYPYQSDGEVADNDPDLDLVDSDGSELDYGSDDSDPVDDYATERLMYESDADQTVYIRVQGRSDSETSSSYDLTVERGENDENEPNGVIGSATPIEPGTYEDRTLLDDENDYYAISVDEGETLNITATYPYQSDGEVADNDPDLDLIDSDGSELDYGSDDSDPVDDYATERLMYESDADHTVYIRVQGLSDSETSSPYDFTVERGENDENEPNGVIGDATVIEPGTYEDRVLLDDENDYYAISVDEGETLNITATYPYQSDGEVADNDPDLDLVDSDGSELDYGSDDSDPVDDYATERLMYESDADQTVYIRVQGLSDSETSSPYDFTVERGENDENEPNGVIGDATPITPGSYDNLTLLDDESDFYSLSLQSGETLNVTATFPTQSDGDVADNDPSMELVDSDGDNLDYGDEESDPADDFVTESIDYESESAETVYVRIYGVDDAEVTSSYSFFVETSGGEATSTPTPTATPTPEPVTTEPPATATPVPSTPVEPTGDDERRTTSMDDGRERSTEMTDSLDEEEEEEDEDPESTVGGSGPGFTASLAVVALLIAAVLRVRTMD